MKIITDEKQIDDLLTRGIENIYPDRESFKKLLMTGKRIKIYQGYDPSSNKLHIGNAIGMKILEKFRKFGHHIIFLIGTGTGKVGDPTDKLATRTILSDKEINNNIKGWLEQANQILDFHNPDNPVEILKNGDWLNQMSLDNFLKICYQVTIQQLLERDMFQKRIKENKPITVAEILYPLLQGYDSVAMEVDAEFGGNDQMFNMMMGRMLVKNMLHKEKYVITGKLITDTQGVKMGKSLGNVINLTDKPEDIFGKVMSFTDEMICSAFEILTEIPIEEIKQMKREIEAGTTNPMIFKKQLAFEVTKWIKGEKEALKAQKYFEKTVQQQNIPEDLRTYTFTDKPTVLNLIKFLVDKGCIISNGEGKRLVKQGGIEIDGKKIIDINASIKFNKKIIIKIGKRQWVRIKTMN